MVTASDADFATTVGRLEAATARNFNVAAKVDHAAGAVKIEELLRPTTLLVFGNPTVGTAMMQSSQTFGVDLPLKASVHEDAEGQIQVATASISALAEWHGVDNPSEVERVAGVLAEIAAEAAGSGQ